MFPDIIHRDRITLALQFLIDTLRRFQSALDRFKGITLVFPRELFIQHFQSRLDLHNGKPVLHHQSVKRFRLLQLLGLDPNDPVLLPQCLPLLLYLLFQTVLISEQIDGVPDPMLHNGSVEGLVDKI